MEWQNSLLYIVPALFMLILIFPLVFNLRVTMQPFQNIVIFALFFFKIKFLFFSSTNCVKNPHKTEIPIKEETTISSIANLASMINSNDVARINAEMNPNFDDTTFFPVK